MKKAFVLLTAAMLAATPVHAADVADLEARIDELEARIAVLEEMLGIGEDTVETSNEGYFCLVNGSGSTADGDDVIIYCDDPENTYLQLGFEAWGMDGSLKSYIYIDGELSDTMQLDDVQTSIDLTGDALTAGDHEVLVEQYPGNDPEAEPSFSQVEVYTVEE